jgi:amino acid transporter
MDSAMKNPILRVLIGAGLLSLIAGIAVTIIGLARGWNTSRQFSDGLFWAGAIMILIGFVSYQGYSQRASDGTSVALDPAERDRLWAADTSRGKNLMASFGISGLLLFGLSFLIGKLF